MAKANPFFQRLKSNYLFSEIEKKSSILKQKEIELLDLGIGDVTFPLFKSVSDAITQATNELTCEKTHRGYGPSQGYLFLREAITDYYYKNLNISSDEIFISNGTKNDLANMQELFCQSNIVAVCDPTYPVYVDTNVMAGRSKKVKKDGTYDGILYLPCLEENQFVPTPPKTHADLIYLCSPNNPTGKALTRNELKKWVDYAKSEKAIIFFDGAYEAFIQSKDVPRSIFEIKGALDVAIEFRSFSKMAGFTSLRCSYIVIPKTVKVHLEKEKFSLLDLWKKRCNVKFGGVSYPIQKAAAALFTFNGQMQWKNAIKNYQEQTAFLYKGLQRLGFKVFGGKDSPYVWCKTPNNLSSIEFFDLLLKEANILSIPGSGFGPSGEGFVRFSGFTKKQVLKKAILRLEKSRFF